MLLRPLKLMVTDYDFAPIDFVLKRTSNALDASASDHRLNLLV